MADGVWKGVQSYVIGHSNQLLLNRFFDPSTPSKRKVDAGEKKKKEREREKNGENSGPLTSLPVDRLNGDQLQHRRLCHNNKKRRGALLSHNIFV